MSYFTDAKHAAQLTGLLKYHISNEVVNTTNVYPNQKITTLQGSNLFIEYIQSAWPQGGRGGSVLSPAPLVNDHTAPLSSRPQTP